MDIQALSLEAGKTVRDLEKSLADKRKVVQSFFDPEIGQIVAADFVAQVGGQFFVLLEKRILPVSGVGPAPVHGFLFGLGKLRPGDQRPIVELFTDPFGAEPVRHRLQPHGIGYADKGMVFLAEIHTLPCQFPFHIGVPVEIGSGLKR